MKLNHKQLSLIAKELGVSERAIERLTSSTMVEVPRKIDFETVDIQHAREKAVERFQLGLRLQSDIDLAFSQALQALCVSALREYRSNCPQAVQWVCSGDFNPTKKPESLTRANILHASRTASRLRAKLLRQLPR